MTIIIKVNENGIEYECTVDGYDVYLYIKNNQEIMSDLTDEQKILRAIYELWIEDEFFIKCFDIPENSPCYGKRWCSMENISRDDIKLSDEFYNDKSPTKILNKCRLNLECEEAMKNTLEADSCYVGISCGGMFYIGIDSSLLYFDRCFNFIEGNFYGKYRLKKNRGEFIKKIKNAIDKNIQLIRDYYNAWDQESKIE